MYDIVIIGAGVAGALIADQLSQKNLKIVILESGPNDQNRAQYLDNFFSSSPADRFTETGAYPLYEEAPQPTLSDLHRYYVQKGPVLFASPYNRRVGGTTWNWLGSTPRFLPNDFKTKSQYHIGVDWPIDYTDLEPWYSKAETSLGVTHHFPQSCPDKWVNSRLKGKTFESRTLVFEPLPQARDPKKCCGSGICIPICPVQAKYDATIHVNKAVNNGVELIPQAVVFKLETDASGKITQAMYYDWNKQIHTIRGKIFILAAHAIESPKLLLQSANEFFPQGLANQSDQVGRNLMDHPCLLTIARAPEIINTYRGPHQTSGFFGFRDGAFRKDFMAYYTAIQNDAGAWPKGSPSFDVDQALAQGLWGQKLKESLHKTLNSQLVLCAMSEQLPNPNNRMTLSKEHRDFYGLPRPEIHYSYSDIDVKSFGHMRSSNEAIMNAVGATDIEHHPTIYSSSHIIGTLRMGDDPKRSVVNKHCRAHAHENLYVAGSSVFPTSGTANPTLTIAALALRLADTLRNMSL